MLGEPLMSDPDLTSAFRFLAAAGAQGVALLTLNYAMRLEQRYAGHRIALIGWSIEAQAVAIHQAYYWVWWLLIGARPDLVPVWQSWRWVTSVALVIMAAAWILVASPYLVRLAGPYWVAAGGAIAATLWSVGYGFATWL